jgi:hypothetical protein
MFCRPAGPPASPPAGQVCQHPYFLQKTAKDRGHASQGTTGTMPALLLPDDTMRGKMPRLNSIVGTAKGMSHWLKSVMASVAGLAAASSACFGQTNLTPTLRTTERDGRIVVSEQQATDLGLNPTLGPAASVDRQNLSDAVKDRLRRFELSRDAYLREQEQLRKRLEGAATEAERERVRALIKVQREAWLQRMRDLRVQAKDRIAELRRRLPSRAEILDNAKQTKSDTISELRNRRAIDR